MCIRAELFLLLLSLLLLELEAIKGHAAPSCVDSSLTSFNLHSILNNIFAEFAAFSYSTCSVTWSNWNHNVLIFNKQWTSGVQQQRQGGFLLMWEMNTQRPLRTRVRWCEHKAGAWQAQTVCFSIMNFLCDLYQKPPFVCLFSSCKMGSLEIK